MSLRRFFHGHTALCIPPTVLLVVLVLFFVNILLLSNSVQNLDHKDREARIYTKQEKPKKLFVCGYSFIHVARQLFPDYQEAGIWTRNATSDKNDVMLVTTKGPCDGDTDPNPRHIQTHFRGKILFLNGESYGHVLEETSRLYEMGPFQHDSHSIRVYWLVPYLFQTHYSSKQHWDWILDPSEKQRNNGKYNAVAYMTSNCVPFRQEAAYQLAEIVSVHYGTGCRVASPNAFQVETSTRTGWTRNWELFRDYKYCLVMENTNQAGYITEKLLNAFMGDCLPIYYGTREVFEIFNQKAFIYYDVDNPRPALDYIRYLEGNATAYNQVMLEPILANGEETIEQYFSLSDRIGHGVLKKRIRSMMGIE